MAKTPLEMPRGNLATGKKNVWAFANTPASLAANALAFAGTPASLAANARAFAGVPQERFSPFWRLQKFCKCPFPHFDVCRTSAKAVFSILTFAEVLQRPSPGARRLMLSSNSRIEEAEAVCDGGYLWRRFQTMKDEKMDYGCDDRVCDGGKRTGV